MRILDATLAATVAVLTITALAAAGEWVSLEDQTTERLVSDPSVGIDDEEEKDFAWGDVDNDGDVDLVVVRKQPWSTTGRRQNVLFMNEGIAEGHALDGVLVDRTAEYASAATGGGNGMRDLTNDRDVAIVDVNNDGWLDVVTATTLSDGQDAVIYNPRVYINLGNGPKGWLGLQYEPERIPVMHPTASPRFNAVAAGDVTGDGFADLYFVDYDLGGNETYDYNNRLLINDGNGYFADESASRMTPQMLQTMFATAGIIGDFNGDGAADIARSDNGPGHGVSIAWNDPNAPGYFTAFEVIYGGSPTHLIAGHLNDDGLLDLVVTDDGTDRYLLNLGNGVDGLADFQPLTFPDTAGFAGNSAISDLDGDGLNDVVITDVDFEIAGCSRDTVILHNTGTASMPAFVSDPGNVPLAQRVGTHDVAIFDLDGNGHLDMILGRCTGLRVLVNGTISHCLADTNTDGEVDVDDLINVILDWGTGGSANGGDIDASGLVDVNDLVRVILGWGEC